MVSDFPVDVWKKIERRHRTVGLSRPTRNIIGLIDGKYIDTTWDFTGCGYYWADECQTRIGYFIDKTVALDVLSQSQAYFTGRDTSTDVRKYAIGYILPFKAQIQEKIGALLAERLHVDRAVLHGSGTTTVVNNPGWALNSAEHAGARHAARPHRPGGRLHAAALRRALRSVVVPDDVRPLVRRHDAHLRRRQRRGAGAGLELLTTGGRWDRRRPTIRRSWWRNGGTKQWFVYTDATSGKTYAAQSMPRSATAASRRRRRARRTRTRRRRYRNDTGVRMLETARTLDCRPTQAGAARDAAPDRDLAGCAAKTQALQKFKQNIDVMRSLHNAFGYAVLQDRRAVLLLNPARKTCAAASSVA